MRKDRIKVIKRLDVGKTEMAKATINITKIENVIRTKLVSVVKDWITERQENNQIEKLFSENNMLAWKCRQQN